MADPLIQLLLLIEDEFRGLEGVRIRTQSPSTTRRAPDLEQDYDPHSGSVHRVAGVKVQTRKREYFFPEEWIRENRRAEIDRQVREIIEAIEDGIA
jgi:hypothetical protein